MGMYGNLWEIFSHSMENYGNGRNYDFWLSIIINHVGKLVDPDRKIPRDFLKLRSHPIKLGNEPLKLDFPWSSKKGKDLGMIKDLREHLKLSNTGLSPLAK